jgi:hypothetical protein
VLTAPADRDERHFRVHQLPQRPTGAGLAGIAIAGPQFVRLLHSRPPEMLDADEHTDKEQRGNMLMERPMEPLVALQAPEEEVEREWRWLNDTLNEIARVRAEHGDAQAFRLMEHQAMRVGQRRVDLRSRWRNWRERRGTWYAAQRRRG